MKSFMESFTHDKKKLLICVVILALIVLFVLNYKKSNIINALKSKLPEAMENTSNVMNTQQGIQSDVPTVMPEPGEPKDTIRLFYVDWCGHCQRLLPEWNAFAAEYKNKLNIEKIDCDKNKEMGAGVSGYPTVRLYKGNGTNKVIEFSGQRTADGLKRFVDANRN